MAQKISENKKYWTNFYKSFNEKNPSSFAIFCDTYFNLKNTLITDFGCGNGRDTIFFHNLGYKVWGVDEIIPKSKGYIFLKRDILDKREVKYNLERAVSHLKQVVKNLE